MSDVGVSVSSSAFLNFAILMIAERTLSGLAYPQKIEEISKELTTVIEDFDRAMDVETLRLVKESSKYLLASIR